MALSRSSWQRHDQSARRTGTSHRRTAFIRELFELAKKHDRIVLIVGALISIGGILQNTVRAAERLAEEGIETRVLSMHTLKPLDVEAVLAVARETEAIFTIEEHSILGGLGTAVAEVLLKRKE